RRTHLRLEVVGSYLRAGNDDALFAFVGLLYAAIKEVGDMRILFGFGNTQLLQFIPADNLSQRIINIQWRVGYVYVKAVIVGGKGSVMQIKVLLRFKLIEVLLGERPCNLPCTIA